MGAIDKFLNAMKMNSEVDDDEYYDDFDDEEVYEEKPAFGKKAPRVVEAEDKKNNKVANFNKKRQSNVNGMQIFCIKPQSMEDAKEITETLLENKAVILNLSNVDIDLARRVLDYTIGTTYALAGSLQKITDTIFVAVPDGVDITGAFADGIPQ